MSAQRHGEAKGRKAPPLRRPLLLVLAAALFFAAFESSALTGQSLVVSHGWFMQ